MKSFKTLVLCLGLLVGTSSVGLAQTETAQEQVTETQETPAPTSDNESANTDSANTDSANTDSANTDSAAPPAEQAAASGSTSPDDSGGDSSAPASTEAAKAEQAAEPEETKKAKKSFLEKFAPILILLIVVGIVLARLPQVEGVNHSAAYRKRRVLNWLPLGLTYAFLYMGRYNIKVSQHAFGDKNQAGNDLTKDLIAKCTAEGSALAESICTPLMTNPDFAFIFMVGTWVYGCSFLINGPMVDRLGGKFGASISH
jgi:hypothetical protein